MAYKIIINDRDYNSWSLHDSNTLEQIDINNLSFASGFNPKTSYLLTGDVFDFSKEDTANIRYEANIRYSPVRSNSDIPAVLNIASNKTYGNYNGRNLYKCVPDDMRLPAFLVPYTIKNVGFSKVFINLYVTIKVVDWTPAFVAPIATISQNIGPIDILNNYYEYQLYCKSLNSSMQKFNKDARSALDFSHDTGDVFIEKICKQYPSLKSRTDAKIFTIDPLNSTDLDDGFSIKELTDSSWTISIYIANVTVCIDFLNLWSSFSQRISTIYLPDKKRPMLPTILSDCLCSLLAGTARVALVLDITVETDLNTGVTEIISHSYSNCIINVAKNYVYEDASLLKDADYNKLVNVCNLLSQTKKYKYISSVKNSHDLVTYLMILMNYYSAKTLLTYNVGIFRSTIVKNTPTSATSMVANLDADFQKFVTIWNSSCGHYVDLGSINDVNINLNHDSLDLDAYVHITSPIRRIVDLLNIIQLQQVLNLVTLSPKSAHFLENWIQRLDYINVTMRAIKRIQNDCTLLDTCFNNPSILNKLYDGYCFDKIERSDGLFQFVVYLPELKLTTRITIREPLENFEKRQWKLFLFNNEAKSKRKIRLSLI